MFLHLIKKYPSVNYLTAVKSVLKLKPTLSQIRTLRGAPRAKRMATAAAMEAMEQLATTLCIYCKLLPNYNV